MDDILQVSNADQAPLENPQVPAEQAGITVQADDAIGNYDSSGIGTIATEETPGAPPPIQVDTEEIQPQEELSAREDPSRFEFWQSRADTAMNENRKMQEQLDYFQETLGPIDRAIKENPKVLDNLEASFSNGQPAQQPSLKMPEAPARPSNYNEVDSVNDPDSESFRYRTALNDYNSDVAEYTLGMEQQRQKQHENLQERQQQENLRRQDVMLGQQFQDMAINQYGMNYAEAQDFVSWARDPKNVLPEHLVKLYKISKQPQGQGQVQYKQQQMTSQKQRMQIPTPAAVQTGQSPPPMDDEDMFNAGLMSLKR